MRNLLFEFDDVRIRESEAADKNYLTQNGLPLSPNVDVKIKQFIHGRKPTEYYPAVQPSSYNTGTLSISADGSVAPCGLAYDNLLSMGTSKMIRSKTSLRKMVNLSRISGQERTCQRLV